MSRDDQFMPLYVGDYLADTGHLTVEEHGAYLLLLMQAWTRGGSLPADEDRLRALARMGRREWLRARDAVLAFFVRDGDRLRNKRVDRELDRATKIIAERSAAGRAGAAKRWKKINDLNDVQMAKPSVCQWQNDANHNHNHNHIEEKNPSVSPLAEPKPPRSPKGSRLTDGFQPDYAFARSLGLDAVQVHAAFRDYWRAKAGSAGVKLDWQATWRNWCRREAERKPGAGPPRRQQDTAADRMRALFPDPPARDPGDDDAIEVKAWHES